MPNQKPHIDNLLYFEAPTMRELYDYLKSWQEKNRQPFLCLNVQQESGNFSCIVIIDAENLKEKIAKTEYEEAMTRFERKALRVIVKEKNIGAIVEFVHPIISGQKILAIQKRLMECTTAREIRTVFEEEF